MCGIACCYSVEPLNLDEARTKVRGILTAQHRRGPDYTGLRCFERCVLGHNRLSIMDLSSRAHQPMSASGIHVVFNGEVFNFHELRRELEGLGHQFHTSGDTEVVLKLYLQFEEDCFEKLRGQFAIVVYDERKQALVLARDPFGIKPLYYHARGSQVLAASSCKALAEQVGAQINEEALAEYLCLRFVLPPDTLLRDIHQVEPGTYIRVSADGTRKTRYWDFSFDRSGACHSSPEDAVFGLLTDSIGEQLTADVPLGLFLSGGLDSSIVAKVASSRVPRLNSYSIRFAEFSDEELRYARLASDASRTNHRVCEVNPKEIDYLVEQLFQTLDSPSGARDALAMQLLARQVKKETPDVKVILTGTGADEIFNGYMNAYFTSGNEPVTLGNLRQVLQRYIRNYGLTSAASWQILESFMSTRSAGLECLEEKLFRRLSPLVAGAQSIDPINFHNLFYCVTHLVGWELPIADDTAAQCSLEIRVPFLDPRLVDYVFAQPGALKFSAGVEKKLLRDAFRGKLPDAIITRPKGPFSRQVMQFLEKHLLKRVSMAGAYGCGKWGLDARGFNPSSHPDLWWRIYGLEEWSKSVGKPSHSPGQIEIADLESTTPCATRDIEGEKLYAS